MWEETKNGQVVDHLLICLKWRRVVDELQRGSATARHIDDRSRNLDHGMLEVVMLSCIVVVIRDLPFCKSEEVVV